MTLNERQNQQLLCMMYKRSKNPSLLCENNPDARITLNATKIRFNIKFTNITRVQKKSLVPGKLFVESATRMYTKVKLKI